MWQSLLPKPAVDNCKVYEAHGGLAAPHSLHKMSAVSRDGASAVFKIRATFRWLLRPSSRSLSRSIKLKVTSLPLILGTARS
jgi:hypothetical protein